MTRADYLNCLVDTLHSATVATIGADGHPQTRVIDLMYWDEDGVYFLTAKGKAFYEQLLEQKYIALSSTDRSISISLRGFVRPIGNKHLDLMFEKNPYMKQIYPGDTRRALEVFCLYEAEGEYFDISVPSHVIRDSILIGSAAQTVSGYEIERGCTGCGKCRSVCPQSCIDLTTVPARIDEHRCLHCGQCAAVCPAHAVKRRSRS